MDNGHGRGGHKDKDTDVRWGSSDGYILSFLDQCHKNQTESFAEYQSYIRKYLSSLWPRFFLF